MKLPNKPQRVLKPRIRFISSCQLQTRRRWLVSIRDRRRWGLVWASLRLVPFAHPAGMHAKIELCALPGANFPCDQHLLR